MKKIYSLLIYFLLVTGLQTHAFTWVQKANFTSGLRAGAFAFSIGNKGYVGSGIKQTGTSTIAYVNDFWEYNPATDAWTQMANVPYAISSPAAFELKGKGYISTGYTGSTYLAQTWEYNPATNIWGAKANFPGAGRYTTSCFVIGDNAYVGQGKSGPYHTDFYKYDAVSDSWTSVAAFPGGARQSARCFTIGNYGYIIGGANVSSGNNYHENWQYDEANNSWSQKASYPGIGSYGGIAFSLNGLGYLGCGSTISTNVTANDLYSYDPVANTWAADAPFAGGVRNSMSCLVIGNGVYAGLGSTGIYPVINYQSDWWSFGSTVGIHDVAQQNCVTVFMNHSLLNLKFQSAITQNGLLQVYDTGGKLILKEVLLKGTTNYETTLKCEAKGIYYCQIYNGENLVKSQKLALQ